jgi:hypothetical protein
MRMSGTTLCSEGSWMTALPFTCERMLAGWPRLGALPFPALPCVPLRTLAYPCVPNRLGRASQSAGRPEYCLASSAVIRVASLQDCQHRQLCVLCCCSNIGDGGNKEGPDSKYYPQPKYSAFREPSYGHGTLDLVDETHAGGLCLEDALKHAVLVSNAVV